MPYRASIGTTNYNMKNLLLFVSLMLSVTLFTSCATLFCKKQTVTVNSDVEGADVYFGSKYVGKTPFSYETKKTKMVITVKKDGYEPQQILTNRSVKGVVWLDCLAGGIPGLVDLCSGKYWKYKETDYYVSMTDPSVNEAHNARINKKYEWVNVVGQLAVVATQGLEAYGNAKQAENAQKAAIEKAQREQQQAAMQAHWAEQRAQAKAKEEAKQREELARVYGGSRSLTAQMEAEKNKSQSRSWSGTDIEQYIAIKNSDAIYGKEATDQALAQQRQYDAEQNQQVLAQQRQINQQQMQQAQSQQSYPGNAVNAVTSSGAHVQIKVNGTQVTAYSYGNNLMGPEWDRVVPAATVQETSNPISLASSDIASRFAYQASVRGLGMVYWGTPTRRVINDAPNGTPVKAVTKEGQTLTIMVNGNNVVAYGSGLNQASDIQWHRIVPGANITETDSSFDGNLSTRFKHKANIPGIGTVYF